MNANNTTINEIDATIDAIFNEHNNDALTIVDIATTTFTTTHDDTTHDEIVVCDMFVSCM